MPSVTDARVSTRACLSHKEVRNRLPAGLRNNMKYKSFALWGVLCGLGIAYVFLRPDRPAGNRQSIKPSVQSSPAKSEAVSQAAPRPQVASPLFAALAQTNHLFRTTEALWREPVAEEAFARFKDWTQRYLATDPASRAGLVPEGVELAGAR